MAHLRAHASELALERSGAAPGELDDRRELIGRLRTLRVQRDVRARAAPHSPSNLFH